jgi:signal transduction histidine kinase
VKFSEFGGKIDISLKQKDSGAIICVADNGPGISVETGKKIFEKFYQGDTSHSSEGNGLGLPLVKKVIDILGGEISVKSEIGKGSTFTIILKGTGADE